MAGPLPAATCPRCGEVSRGPLAASGTCFRCLGERAFSGMPADELTSGVPAADIEAAAVPDRIGGYEIIEELGRGGMGRVYAARQGALGRIVAVKVIAAGVGGDPDLQLRFVREAQTLARLRHQHIVAVHDYGRAGGQAYLVMDFIEGGDLSKRLRERPPGPREGAELCRKIALALAYTHNMGVLHRDLKPSNILLDGDEPKVADFGLAAELEMGGLTAVTRILGTPQYLAPEVLGRGSAASSRAADIYSLGVILFETLTGRTPFAGASPAELPALVASVEPPPPRLLAPAVPRDLETICLKCLEQDPARRYATAGDLGADLGRFLEGMPILAKPVSPAGRLVRWCKRRPALAAIWLLTALIAAGSTTAAVWIARERARTEAALRDSKLEEARAVRSLSEPGRRARALAALATAAKIRPGADLRNEALASMVIPDIERVDRWGKPSDQPVQYSYAADGNSVVRSQSSADGRVQGQGEWFRNRLTGAPQPLKVPKRVIGGYRFSRDQSLVMARTIDDSLSVWRTGVADPILVLHRPTPTPTMLLSRWNVDYDFAPDGRWLAVGGADQGGGVTFHRIPDGAEIGRFRRSDVFPVLRISPDGKRMVVAEGTIPPPGAPVKQHPLYIVEAPSGRLLLSVMTTGRAAWLEWSQDSRWIAVTLENNSVDIYDAADGRILQTVRLAVDDMVAAGFVGDSRFLACRGSGSSLRIASQELPSQQLVIDDIGAADLSVDDASTRFVSPLTDAHFESYRMCPPIGLRVLRATRQRGYGFGFGPGALDISPDGRWIATGFNREVVIRDSGRGRIVAETASPHNSETDLYGVAFGPEANCLYAGSAVTGLRRIPLVPTADGWLRDGPPEVVDAEPGYALADHSRDRRKLLLIDQEHERVKVLAVDGIRARTLGAWSSPGIYSGVFNSAGDAVLLNPSGLGPSAPKHRLQIRHLDGSLGTDLGTNVSCDAAWSPDGSCFMTSAGNQDSIVWDAGTFKPRLTIHGTVGGNITTFAIAGDGSFAAIQRDRMVHFVRLSDGAELGAIDIPEASGFTQALRFMPDGKRVAVLWNEGRVDIIDIPVLRGELRKIGLDW